MPGKNKYIDCRRSYNASKRGNKSCIPSLNSVRILSCAAVCNAFECEFDTPHLYIREKSSFVKEACEKLVLIANKSILRI